ncbi:hypothetical protein GCM10017779_64280 [Streptomyces capillispiralis]|uniref:Lipoprotein n=2 Tax=Streptomyces capillispiralis TaxID=68182 RepID=A0A561TJ59_9ACTN|nr:hypothetical protein FHX78_114168 [Streptomyces capillispiralis]GHH95971.1 hypothetical protein GCM10017779_64280 [Streptomyces capillispiralis]
MGMTSIAAIAAGLLTIGCSADLTDSTAHVTPTPPAIAATSTAPATGYDGLTGVPLSAYGTSEQDDVLLHRTNEALVARCMQNRGYTSYSGQKKTRAAAKTKEEKEAIHPAGAWGYIGSATAKRIGFHVAVPLSATQGPTGRELKDYNACWDKADKQVPSLAGTRGWKLTQDLFGQSFQQAAADSRVGAARERWSDCMSTAGHPADDPEELANGFLNAEKATAKEIAAATADESCTRSSNLAAVYFAVLTGYQQQLISANAEVLTGYKKQVQAQVDRAAHLLAASNTT